MIPQTILVAAESFGDNLSAERVAAAIGEGMLAENRTLEVDRHPLGALSGDFDSRLRGARAVVIAFARLDHETLLRGAAAFETATRARQAGVPCYAVGGHVALDPFEARILDLQVVLQATGARGLRAAGRRLARLV